MTINGIKTEARKFAFDGCHKIYLLESDNDKNEALANGYNIYHIHRLEYIYQHSCPIKFINSWDLQTTFAHQGEMANFEI